MFAREKALINNKNVCVEALNTDSRAVKRFVEVLDNPDDEFALYYVLNKEPGQVPEWKQKYFNKLVQKLAGKINVTSKFEVNSPKLSINRGAGFCAETNEHGESIALLREMMNVLELNDYNLVTRSTNEAVYAFVR